MIRLLAPALLLMSSALTAADNLSHHAGREDKLGELIQRQGIETDKFSSSTGTMKGLESA